MEGKRKAVATSSSRSKKGTGKQPLRQPELAHLAGAPLFRNDTQTELYSKLFYREIRSTKFYDRPSMRGLGVHRGIVSLFKSIKWDGFLTLEAPLTYATLTREFLASFKNDDSARKLTFRLHSQPRMLSYDQLNAIVRTPTEGYVAAYEQAFRDAPITELWNDITVHETFYPSRQKENAILHPCWRIAHRLLSSCILAKQDPTNLNTLELQFLYQMASRRPNIPDFATFFLSKCRYIVKEETRAICIGGFVTLIAEALDLQIHEPPVDENNLLDTEALLRMHMLGLGEDYEEGSYNWLYHEKKPLYILPNDNISAFNRLNKATWKPQAEFDLPPSLSHPDIARPQMEEEEEEEEEEEQHSGGQHIPQHSGGHLPSMSVLTYRMQELMNERIDPQIGYLHHRVDGMYDMVQNIPTRADWDHYHSHGNFPPVLPHVHIARNRRNLPSDTTHPFYNQIPRSPGSYGIPPEYPPPGGYYPYPPPPGGAGPSY